MPTYQYRCPKGHVFDVFQKMSDPPKAKCPKCGKAGERMIVAGAGFLLKGDGFYITDNRSESYKKEAGFEIPGSTFNPREDAAKKSKTADDAGTKGSEAKGSEAKESGAKGGKKDGGDAKPKGPSTGKRKR